jgi:hypothetical protein
VCPDLAITELSERSMQSVSAWRRRVFLPGTHFDPWYVVYALYGCAKHRIPQTLNSNTRRYFWFMQSKWVATFEGRYICTVLYFGAKFGSNRHTCSIANLLVAHQKMQNGYFYMGCYCCKVSVK